ncbi:hypothetical protein HOP50_14g71480 [Chloropicon primus]|uniref:Uncharacterized protein n=2 Tax=Chloropicon primus TaxID=1764295 RepID=A0A5B8MYH9_9CHLO|nr:hypothetical protein A3770_14p71280 [Chloropicon primus]UPR03818.1 hypothetical protein HOP50_14g71480 [Chloropicon primus]|eukprot:QDZ24610.1 hypothetical protein A3770_14p71280 [Chloropicon primus]
MSLLFGDQEDEVRGLEKASRRLGALFDTDDQSTEEANVTTFKYEPKTSPSPSTRPRKGGSTSSIGGGGGARGSVSKQAPGGYTTVSAGNRVLYATTISQLYKTVTGTEPMACGAAGVALIEETPRSISLVVYDKTKSPFFRSAMTDEFTIVPQSNNYVAFVSPAAAGEGETCTWSLLFPSQAESHKFTYSVATARLMASTLASEKTSTGEPIELFQDSMHSDDDKVAATGDTVQVIFSAWVNKSLHARSITKDDVMVHESVAKFEVGKKASSVPGVVSRAVEGMRRASKRLGFVASVAETREPEGCVYTVSSYEITLSKIRKNKGSSSGRSRKETTGSFSEDVRPQVQARSASPQPQPASPQSQPASPAPSVEEETHQPQQPKAEKSEKEKLIERMAKLSAAQNPYGTAPINMFAKPTRSLSSLSASPPVQSPPVREPQRPMEPEQDVASPAAPEAARAQREPQEDHSPNKAKAESANSVDDQVAEEAPRAVAQSSPGGKKEPVSDSPLPAKTAQSSIQMVLPPGWHYVAPPSEAMPPPKSASAERLSKDMSMLSSQMADLMKKLDRVGGKEEQEPPSPADDAKIDSAMECVDKTLNEIVESMQGLEGWNKDLNQALAGAIEKEKEALKARLTDSLSK